MLAAVSFAGVDVGFVPTDSAAARAALAWAGVGPGDSVFELGCGDGRVAEEVPTPTLTLTPTLTSTLKTDPTCHGN